MPGTKQKWTYQETLLLRKIVLENKRKSIYIQVNLALKEFPYRSFSSIRNKIEEIKVHNGIWGDRKLLEEERRKERQEKIENVLASLR